MEFTFHNSYVIIEPATSSDLVVRSQLLTQKLLKIGYVASKLKSSLTKLYGHYHDLVERYEILISQMTMDLLLLRRFFVFPLSLPRLSLDLTVYMSNTTGVLLESGFA